jgi:hypothetical protein
VPSKTLYATLLSPINVTGTPKHCMQIFSLLYMSRAHQNLVCNSPLSNISHVPTKTLYATLLSPIYVTCPPKPCMQLFSLQYMSREIGRASCRERVWIFV